MCVLIKKCIGVVSYVCLSKRFPYTQGENSIANQILVGKIPYPKYIWDRYSNAARKFINKCLLTKPLDRPSASKALQDTWFNDQQLAADMRSLESNFGRIYHA